MRRKLKGTSKEEYKISCGHAGNGIKKIQAWLKLLLAEGLKNKGFHRCLKCKKVDPRNCAATEQVVSTELIRQL